MNVRTESELCEEKNQLGMQNKRNIPGLHNRENI